MFDVRATVAVLDLLQDTMLGCMVSLAPPAEEVEVEEGKPVRERRGPRMSVSLFFLFFSFSFRRIWDEGGWGALP